jgi:hypothetical protein
MNTMLLILTASLFSPPAHARDTVEDCVHRAERVYGKKMEKLESQNISHEERGALSQAAFVYLQERIELCEKRYGPLESTEGRVYQPSLTCAEDYECQIGKIEAAERANRGAQ